MRECHWNHSEHGGKRGHKDWTDPCGTCLRDCIFQTLRVLGFFLPHLIYVIYQNDSVVHDDSSERDDSQKRHKAQGRTENQKSQHDSDKAKRNSRKNNQRLPETLELQNHHRVDKEKRYQKCTDHGRHCVPDQLSDSCGLAFHTLGKWIGRKIVSDVPCYGSGILRVEPRADCDGLCPVAVVDCAKSSFHLKIADVGKVHHGSRKRFYLNVIEHVGMQGSAAQVAVKVKRVPLSVQSHFSNVGPIEQKEGREPCLSA